MIDTNTDGLKDEQLIDALSKRYLDYAISTIIDRALPDVRDGLKPVHRRLLFAMRELKLSPKTGFKKCARIVGDVIGKYHPHGDVAVYEAMVRLAQDFSVRYPLVDGQGNFGNIDGDGAAAMRYTEARLTEAGEFLMLGLDEDSVDFINTYDGSEIEPVIMPASFPNLLANGAMGIAVGMATNIAPHNVDELCTGLINLIKKPEMDIAKLCDYIKGPDFPTGGIITDKKSHIISVYEKGNGAFTVRSKWEKEELSYGNYQIIITEIPYGIVKSKLIEKIADLMEQKRLPLIADIRDESSSDLRIVIEPRNRTVEPEILMAHLFKLTELEVKFNLNMNVLDSNTVPRVMNLKEVLVEFIIHRKIVLQRRSSFRLSNIERRLEALEGFLIAYLNLDRVIAIIRENDEPKPLMIAEFKLNENQTDAILNMRLRSLRKLEEFEIKGEHDKLSKERDELKSLLSSGQKIDDFIIGELEHIKEIMGKKTKLGKRRSQLVEAENDIVIDESSFIEREAITLLITKGNWIRAVKGHADLNEKFPAKEGDSVVFALHAMTNEKVIVACDNGKFYTIGADKITRGKGFGEPISLMIDIDSGVKIISVFQYEEKQKLLLVNSLGYGFVVESNNIFASTKSGKVVFNLDSGIEMAKIHKIGENDDKVAVISNEKKLLVFNLSEIPELSKGKGVILQKYRDKAKMADIMTFNKIEGLYWITGRGKTTLTDYSLWDSKRANAGYMIPASFPKSLKFN